VGRGASQQHQQTYNRTTTAGSVVVHLGEGFHINWLLSAKSHLEEIDADQWKTWVHQRFTTPTSNPRAITLFQATPSEHLAFAKHLTAEVKTEEFISGNGMVTKWERLRKQNHWFDALSYASVAGHYCGVRLVEEVKPEPKPAAPRRQRVVSPWIDRERWLENQRRLRQNRR
jgi:hypothetical protein